MTCLQDQTELRPHEVDKHSILLLVYSNRIYNKIFDRDWFSARLFVT